MNKILLAFTIMIFSFTSVSYAELSKAEVEKFVKEAAAYAKQVGKQQALEEFNKPTGRFIDGALYMYAYDFDGKVLAHGAKPKLAGKNLMLLRDAKGNKVIYELNEIAKQKGAGWFKYHWENPKEGKVMVKWGYVEKIDETYWIGSGLYEK